VGHHGARALGLQLLFAGCDTAQELLDFRTQQRTADRGIRRAVGGDTVDRFIPELRHRHHDPGAAGVTCWRESLQALGVHANHRGRCVIRNRRPGLGAPDPITEGAQIRRQCRRRRFSRYVNDANRLPAILTPIFGQADCWSPRLNRTRILNQRLAYW